ncbi:hypothetical protein HPP92_006596 [Vanilla planifolia]|uniref:Uncharacterized protein n=1 Tax=Vanilla planifolia TaxID=51239 RepID=A0A835V5C3_VANPL|nr:hypothetical protein HPP92_006860 [Vanilla planifolia]KAG0489733.1 hypothetical protein HPP92_006596 [Vanilla planifolia]
MSSSLVLRFRIPFAEQSGALPASEEFRQSPCTQDTPKQDLQRQDESIEVSCPKGELYQTMAGSGKDYCDSYS